MKRLLLMMILLSGVSYGAQNNWYVPFEDDFGLISTFNFREEVLATQQIGFSAASGTCATGKTLKECDQYFQYNLTALQSALSNKQDVPGGTPSGSKFLRDDNTWQALPAQVQPDWNAGSAPAQILNKPTLGTAAALDVASSGNASSGQVVKGSDGRLTDSRSPTAHTHPVADISDSTSTGRALVTAASAAAARSTIGAGTSSFDGVYTSLTSIPSTFAPSAHTHPASQISDSTTTGRAVLTAANAADARTAIGAGTSSFDGAFPSLTSKPTTIAGYGLTDAYSTSNPSSYINQAGARSAISLTTTGSGAATYNSSTGVLNVPTDSGGTVTSVAAGTGLSGGTITTSGTISMPNTGTAGTYNTVTTDAQGRVTAGTVWSTSCPSRSLNTAFQISTTQMAEVRYAIDISVTSLILAGQEGLVVLEYADNSGMSTNVVTVFDGLNSTAGVLNITNKATIALVGKIPAGKYVRIRTVNTTGSPTFTYRRGCEDLL